MVDNGTGTFWALKVSPSGELSVADGWQNGKRVRFQRDADKPDAAGPDAEGITVGPRGQLYIASERDNSAKGTNQNTILKVDPNAAGPDVVASQEWDVPADSADLYAAILAETAALNTGFSEPLPTSEIRAIAASIHRWITSRFYGWTDSRTVNEATFTTIQSARGHKSASVRRAARDERLAAL